MNNLDTVMMNQQQQGSDFARRFRDEKQSQAQLASLIIPGISLNDVNEAMDKLAIGLNPSENDRTTPAEKLDMLLRDPIISKAINKIRSAMKTNEDSSEGKSSEQFHRDLLTALDPTEMATKLEATILGLIQAVEKNDPQAFIAHAQNSKEDLRASIAALQYYQTLTEEQPGEMMSVLLEAAQVLGAGYEVASTILVSLILLFNAALLPLKYPIWFTCYLIEEELPSEAYCAESANECEFRCYCLTLALYPAYCDLLGFDFL